MEGAVDLRLIPNGVDLSIFKPADKDRARQALGLPKGLKLLLSVGHLVRSSAWKDYAALRAVATKLAEEAEGDPILFLILGDVGPMEKIGRVQVRFIPYQENPELVARYYQAADLYIHMARAETFPNSILEASACGTPAVAASVGGIPEQIEDGSTGILVKPGDITAMGASIRQLLADEEARRRLGMAAAEHASRLFDLNLQVNAYLSWYEEILDHRVAINVSAR